MERSSKLADLKLVSKYYPVRPVANYSYPQRDRQLQYGRRRGHISDDRSSLGSDGSAPGLVEDRTDSEVSMDDDYQYHAHAAELWDSFWLPSPVAKEKKDQEHDHQPRKQYPALIPSPEDPVTQGPEEHRSPAWPLLESPRPRTRKPSATYSPFPKPIALPPRTTSLVPSWHCSRSEGKPKRPPRPDDELLSICVPQLSPVTAHFATSPEACQTTFSRQVIPTERPPVEHHPLKLHPSEHQPTTSLETQPVTPVEKDQHICSEASRSAMHLPLPDTKPLSVMPSKKSLPCLRLAKVEPEPRSVFEVDDSDSESYGRSFFRFHKRAGSSDNRRTAKSSDPSSRRYRMRASTAPSSPARDELKRTSKHEMPARIRQSGEAIGRMLGRRSR